MNRSPLLATLVMLFALLGSFAHAEPATVNINTADVETLATLTGVGPAKAEAIVAYRDANGPFASAEQLAEVKGIGQATVQKNAERLSVE
ncbi:MAG TPA: competence protein ComEA [Marinobacter sp.]|jgi:competence protein ComEA|uniref:ComEA family DNA-binding protein n=1 Tax=Marinobacter sp. TaxID=50741 RepID=UPI000ED0DAF2|nr:ComEA family DNA-binding protein [Marinobacter sp.]MBC7193756.1 helix-hairpin-helix domain-containing protein [Marinobacter sp.]HCW89970.1 competence protein ComEA [Marinobacter sp.]